MVYYVFTVNKTLVLKQFALAGLVLLASLVYTHYETDLADAKQSIGQYGLVFC